MPHTLLQNVLQNGASSSMKYVQNIRGKWVVRLVVPEELRHIIGRNELVHIGLSDNAKARDKEALRVINSYQAQLDEAREVWEALREASIPTLTSAAKEHFRSELAKDDLERASRSKTDEFITKGRATYANKLRLLAAGKLSDDEAEALIGYAANDLRREGKAPPVSRRELLRSLAEIQLEALGRFEERDAGKVSISEPKHPLLTAPDPLSPTLLGSNKPSPNGTTLSAALTAFHKERTAGGSTLAEKTMEEHKNAVRMFNEFMGGETSVRVISKKNVIDYKKALLETPNRYTMRFPGLTLPQAIKANAKRATPFATLAPKTINMKWLSHLSTILQWASNNGHIDSNPAQGVRVDTGSKVHREPSYLPFTKDELKLIFSQPMFSDPKKYGLNEWALLVMLFTGVRNSSEMAGMKLSNILEEQGIPVFNLIEASKNQRSKRLVPIHRDLIKLGFLDRVKELKDAGQTLLFPAWAKRKDKVNDWFNNTFLVSLGLKSKQKVFYSFRHTLATELARAGVARELSKMISGHAPQEVASVYIQAAPVTRKRCVNPVGLLD
jgi:integrase